MRVYLYENDTFRLHLETAQDAQEKYQFDVDDLNADVPIDLVDEYLECEKEFRRIQEKLRGFYDSRR